jgi:hypothetical protein
MMLTMPAAVALGVASTTYFRVPFEDFSQSALLKSVLLQ